MTYEVKYNNSAGRLLAFLSAVRDAGLKENTKLFDVYCKIFPDRNIPAPYIANIPFNNEVLGLQIELNSLVDEVVRQVKGLSTENREYELYAKSLASIDQIKVRFSPSTMKGELEKSFSESIEMALYSFAKDLSKAPGIETSDVEKVRKLIDGLMAEIVESDLPNEIRTFLFNMQSTSRSMLDRYRIAGVQGLKDEFHKILGEMADVYRKDEKKEEHKSIWDKAQRWIHSFDHVIASAGKYPALVDKSADAFDSVSKLMEQ